MTREPALIKGLIIYGTVLPLAVFLGFQMANPLSYDTLAALAVVLLILVTPLVLKWHHPVLLFVWNTTAILPFVPGHPPWWLFMAFISLAVTVVEYAITRRIRLVQHRSVLHPLLFLGAVVLGTALLTGGVGLSILGGGNIGGKRYLFIFGGIAGYLAMTAHNIPPQKAGLYVGLFLLGTLTNAIGGLLPYAPSALYPIFMMFPPEKQGVQVVQAASSVVEANLGISRLGGFSNALLALSFFMLARYGLGRLLDLRRISSWIFIGACVLSTFGGFRSKLLLILITLTFLFFLEGLHLTRKMPVVALCVVLLGAGVFTFSTQLPVSIQRSLSVFPFVQLDPVATQDAAASAEWRLSMWKGLLAEVPNYLLLGKGLSINAADLEAHTMLVEQGRGDSAESSMLCGDYHNGPLSVIIPFGIWGFLGWLWFLGAGLRALYLNYRNGDHELKTINTFFLAYFLTHTLLFFAVFGGFYKDVAMFAGILGLSLCLNGGIKQVSREAAARMQLPESSALRRPRLIPAFPNHLRQ